MIYLKMIIRKLDKYIENKIKENIKKTRSQYFKKCYFKQHFKNARSYQDYI